jgi:hypothetical protein
MFPKNTVIRSACAENCTLQLQNEVKMYTLVQISNQCEKDRERERDHAWDEYSCAVTSDQADYNKYSPHTAWQTPPPNPVENVTFIEKWWCCQSILTRFPIHPITGCERSEGEYRYSSNLSLALALEGVVGQMLCPSCLTPNERNPVPIIQEPGWAPGGVWMGVDPRTIQRTVSHYTDCTILAHWFPIYIFKVSAGMSYSWQFKGISWPHHTVNMLQNWWNYQRSSMDSQHAMSSQNTACTA